MESKTLLRKFTDDKYSNYVEPTRKGVPKGKAIGLSRKKYQMVLLTMGSLRVERGNLSESDLEKATANALHISYGLFSVWKYKEDFHKSFLAHCDEYTGQVLNHVMSRIDDYNKKLNRELGEKTIDQMADYQLPNIEWHGFEDIKSYHWVLKYTIINKIYQIFWSKDLSYRWGLHLFVKNMEYSNPDHYTGAPSNMKDKLTGDIFTKIQEIALKPNFQEADRKRIIFLNKVLGALIEPSIKIS